MRRSLLQSSRSNASSISITSKYAPATRRRFQTSSQLTAKKGAEDKDSINTESTEYSKSGGDGASAGGSAFDASKTRPEEEHESARKESGGSDANNPLNVSPANQEVSQPRGQQEGGAQGSPGETGGGSERSRTSGGGGAPKSGGG